MAFNTISHSLSLRATNIRQTKPRGLGYKRWMYSATCPHSCASNTAFTKPLAHTQPITYNTIPQKGNMIPYTALSNHPLNSQVLPIFFPFATIPPTSHYPVFTDRYSPQYSMLTFLLHVMTNTFLSTFLPFSPPPSASTLFLNHTAGPKILRIPPPYSLSHSPNLGCVGAQGITFLARFLV